MSPRSILAAGIQCAPKEEACFQNTCKPTNALSNSLPRVLSIAKVIDRMLQTSDTQLECNFLI